MFPNVLLRFRSENSRKKADKSSQIRRDACKDRDSWNPVTLQNKDNFSLIDPSNFPIDYSTPTNDSVHRSHGGRAGKRMNRRNKASSFLCILHPLLAGLKKPCNGGSADWSESEEEEEDDKGADLVDGIMDEVLGAVSSAIRIQVSTQRLRDPEKAKAAKMEEEVSVAMERLLVLHLQRKYMKKGMKMEAVRAIQEKTEFLKTKLRLVILGSYEKKKPTCRYGQLTTSPLPELFEATMSQVRNASQSFASLLHFLTRSARRDISGLVRSITAATNATSAIGDLHTRYALDSHVTHKIFHGFNHETFLIDPTHSNYSHNFRQYEEIKHTDPIEFLAANPNGSFSKFCSIKYRSIVHSKMEECFFGKTHPRTEFYREFLGVAKAVWMLHLLSMCLDSAPVLFSVTRGAEFQPWFMDSVVSWVGGLVPMSHNLVGFPISPGFMLGNGTVVKARVYLVSRS